ncbi:MAG: hypothetical protein U0974_02885 [Gemmatimonadales bacterium]|nr:hypothetical protein [Gemmatimonadales bacterium]MDZ4388659.1 hypothetical protein [Gemmatimonadales bacterium]
MTDTFFSAPIGKKGYPMAVGDIIPLTELPSAHFELVDIFKKLNLAIRAIAELKGLVSSNPNSLGNPAAKEVQRYREALCRLCHLVGITRYSEECFRV